MRVHGDNFFEVYNGHPSVHNSGDSFHASTERIWDILLAHRIADLGLPMLYGLANDDGHRYHHIPSRGSEPGRGWIMVLVAPTCPPSRSAGRDRSGPILCQLGSPAHGRSLRDRRDSIWPSTPSRACSTRSTSSAPGPDSTIRASRSGIRRARKSAPRGATATRSAILQIGRRRDGELSLRADDLYVRARVTSTKKHPNPSELGEFERAWVQPVLGPAAPKR